MHLSFVLSHLSHLLQCTSKTQWITVVISSKKGLRELINIKQKSPINHIDSFAKENTLCSSRNAAQNMFFSKMFSGNIFNLFTVSNLAIQYLLVAVLNNNLIIITIQPKASLRGERFWGPGRMTAVQPAMKSLAPVQPVCRADEEGNNSASSSSDTFFMEWHSDYRKLREGFKNLY